ncbi:MAG: ABC transporter permease [Christensenellaceae bacterium]|nr:ABC transporter permease [Christensenellaceae bacterium]
MPDWVSYLTNFLYAAILAGVPLLFGTLGEIQTERAGNLNLGVEGQMYMGAIAGFFLAYATGQAYMAYVGAFAAGALGALIYAFLTVTLKANQNVTGLTLTIFGAGFANFAGENMILSSPTKSAILSDALKAQFSAIDIPGLSDLPVVGRLLFAHTLFVYLGVALALVAGWYLFGTRKGLNLRAVGENPAAADAAGIPVSLYKYVHILLGGGICALGGAYVALVTCGGAWTYNCVNGLGWIAVALVIFAGWNPYRAILGSLVFGALSVLRLYLPAGATRIIPSAMFSMLPFIVTAAVLILSSMRTSRDHAQPRGCGVNYFREER